MSVTVDEKSLERINQILSGIEGGAFRAVSSAMRRAGDSAKTQAGRLAAEEYTIGILAIGTRLWLRF